MDVIGSIVYTLLIIVLIALIVVVVYLYNDYNKYKETMKKGLFIKFNEYKVKDKNLDKGITDNTEYILNTSNILHKHISNSSLNSSNLNLNTSNILHNNTIKLNTEGIEKYDKLNNNLNDNLNNYFIFGLNTDKNKVTNKWDKGLTDIENEKYNKLELIRATSIISGLTIKSETDKNSLNICNAEGGANCYSINYDNNILKIKNKTNINNSSVEIGSLRVFEDIAGVYINNISPISIDKSINIGKLKITNQGISWDGNQICGAASVLCSPPAITAPPPASSTVQPPPAPSTVQPPPASSTVQPPPASSTVPPPPASSTVPPPPAPSTVQPPPASSTVPPL